MASIQKERWQNTPKIDSESQLIILNVTCIVHSLLLEEAIYKYFSGDFAYGISHDRGGHFVPFSVIFAQKLRFEE